jgi:hypothetical protein
MQQSPHLLFDKERGPLGGRGPLFGFRLPARLNDGDVSRAVQESNANKPPAFQPLANLLTAAAVRLTF